MEGGDGAKEGGDGEGGPDPKSVPGDQLVEALSPDSQVSMWFYEEWHLVLSSRVQTFDLEPSCTDDSFCPGPSARFQNGKSRDHYYEHRV